MGLDDKSYEKLLNLDYTAYEHSQDFQSKLDELGIESPFIEVGKTYLDGTPTVVVEAVDRYRDCGYVDVYRLEGVNKEEFEEIMFETWEKAMKELEP